jgi:eukaryotic translation initiation factor 2C
MLPYQIYKRKVPDALAYSMLETAIHHPDTTRKLIEHEVLRLMELKTGANPTTFVSYSLNVLRQH